MISFDYFNQQSFQSNHLLGVNDFNQQSFRIRYGKKNAITPINHTEFQRSIGSTTITKKK